MRTAASAVQKLAGLLLLPPEVGRAPRRVADLLGGAEGTGKVGS